MRCLFSTWTHSSVSGSATLADGPLSSELLTLEPDGTSGRAEEPGGWEVGSVAGGSLDLPEGSASSLVVLVGEVDTEERADQSETTKKNSQSLMKDIFTALVRWEH